MSIRDVPFDDATDLLWQTVYSRITRPPRTTYRIVGRIRWAAHSIAHPTRSVAAACVSASAASICDGSDYGLDIAGATRYAIGTSTEELP